MAWILKPAIWIPRSVPGFLILSVLSFGVVARARIFPSSRFAEPVGGDGVWNKSLRVAVDKYRLQAMPTTLIFDKQGRKVKELRGEVSAEALWAYLGGLL
ncbi:TlpA family protein disulfide reductase [Thermus sp. FJN-A]